MRPELASWIRCAARVALPLLVAASALTPAHAVEPEGAHPAGAAGRADDRAARLVRRHAHPVTADADAWDALLDAIGPARIVLLGEDTHGTREFYESRAQITRRLVTERGYAAVVIEGDLPDAASTRAWVSGTAPAADGATALDGFRRFPRWMWRNAEFMRFGHWLRFHNLARSGGPPVLIHGMDLYDLARSVASVQAYLDAADPARAQAVRAHYDCFSAGGEDVQAYGERTSAPEAGDCRQAAEDALAEVAVMPPPHGDADASDRHFHALQGARAVRAAEEYFRTLWTRPEASWNIRDRHMADRVEALLGHLEATTGRPARVVIWAHNAHVGDARATAHGEAGNNSLGQLLRERLPGETFIVAQSTAAGVVRAATDWGGPDFDKRLRPPHRGSLDAVLHRAGLPAYYLLPAAVPALQRVLDAPRLQRGIGVRYLPALEMAGHYYVARAASQYDAIIHFDRTAPVTPLPP